MPKVPFFLSMALLTLQQENNELPVVQWSPTNIISPRKTQTDLFHDPVQVEHNNSKHKK